MVCDPLQKEIAFLRPTETEVQIPAAKQIGEGGGEMTENIPSDADFARASEAINKQSRGLSDVRERILAQFRDCGEIHEMFILDCSEHSFLAYVFYPRDADIEAARRSGLQPRIENAVLGALEDVGRGHRSALKVQFEWDSHEYVKRNYAGNYYDRLR